MWDDGYHKVLLSPHQRAIEARSQGAAHAVSTRNGDGSTVGLHTLPPFFIPKTDEESAGGGFGPDRPAKLPPAMPPSAFLAFLSATGLPATNWKG